MGDSLFARPRFDPLALLAAVATATRTVTLGTAVLLAPMWHPLPLARVVATVDRLAAGRLVLGVGPGPGYGLARKEFAALGVPVEDRLSRLAEIVGLCRELWGEGPVESDGRWRFRNVDLYPKPVRSGGPPIWWGVRGPRALALAGAAGEGWLPVGRSPEEYAAGLATVRAGGPAVTVPAVYLTVAVDADPARAGQRLQTAQEDYYRAPWEAIRTLEDHCAGTAADVLAHLDRYVEAGARHVVLRFAGGDPVVQLRAVLALLDKRSTG
ncbi:LLM class flavin-dependent oxidoreductase [Pseudonocardia sp. NPDC049154]|uniref:LLM class flavin-dependent oxidoreductase n=1 Tax=Pseudonocardia sp. NPDC049154 TaxID=3155501 RepID=UPI0033C7110A